MVFHATAEENKKADDGFSCNRGEEKKLTMVFHATAEENKKADDGFSCKRRGK